MESPQTLGLYTVLFVESSLSMQAEHTEVEELKLMDDASFSSPGNLQTSADLTWVLCPYRRPVPKQRSKPNLPLPTWIHRHPL